MGLTKPAMKKPSELPMCRLRAMEFCAALVERFRLFDDHEQPDSPKEIIAAALKWWGLSAEEKRAEFEAIDQKALLSIFSIIGQLSTSPDAWEIQEHISGLDDELIVRGGVPEKDFRDFVRRYATTHGSGT